jgi:tetratricopeptide (TPR) repeat protein
MGRIKVGLVGIALGCLLGAGLGCQGQDPDVRRGDLFYGNGKYYEAYQAYERAYARKAELFDDKELRERFKNVYYHGGQMELAGSLEPAIKYYEKGFDLVPDDPGMCDKLAKYFWAEEDFEKAAKYFGRLVELDAQAPDTERKWQVLGDDYYALGYSLAKIKKYQEAIEALRQSLKAAPRGRNAAKAKSALESAKFELSKQK